MSVIARIIIKAEMHRLPVVSTHIHTYFCTAAFVWKLFGKFIAIETIIRKNLQGAWVVEGERGKSQTKDREHEFQNRYFGK